MLPTSRHHVTSSVYVRGAFNKFGEGYLRVFFGFGGWYGGFFGLWSLLKDYPSTLARVKMTMRSNFIFHESSWRRNSEDIDLTTLLWIRSWENGWKLAEWKELSIHWKIMCCEWKQKSLFCSFQLIHLQNNNIVWYMHKNFDYCLQIS